MKYQIKWLIFVTIFGLNLVKNFARADVPLGIVTLGAEPDQFAIGRNFLLKCNAQLLPNDNAWRYRVSFVLNDEIIGEYSVSGLTSIPAWHGSHNPCAGVNIYPESYSRYPDFFATVQPLSYAAIGIYQCLIRAEFVPTYPTVTASFESNRWNTNASTINYVPVAEAAFSWTAEYDSSASPEIAVIPSQSQTVGRSRTFVAQCVVSIATPGSSIESGNYAVRFHLDSSTDLGEYVVTQQSSANIPYSYVQWQTLSLPVGVNVFPRYEQASYPNFFVLVSVSSAANDYFSPFSSSSSSSSFSSWRSYGDASRSIAQRMRCSVTLEIPRGGRARYFSTFSSNPLNGAGVGVTQLYHSSPLLVIISLATYFCGFRF